MTLSEFISEHREPILKEWEAFARSCKPASGVMDVEALRDHADEMLSVIAEDLASAQSSHEQLEKSKGRADDSDTTEETAAEEHGAVRAESGFSVEQMVAEFRALRASVVRLWTEEKGELRPADVVELTRFNEAIDQALAESVTEYNRNLDQAKEIFLAILGHDLRTPLGAIHLRQLPGGDTASPGTGAYPHHPHRQQRQPNGGYGRRPSGFHPRPPWGGIPIKRQSLAIGKLVHEVVDEICAAHPDRKFEVETRREGDGEWDRERLSQALSNLISNAVQHGDAAAPIHVEVVGGDRDVRISIHNQGTPIPKNRLDGTFNPMKPRDKIIEPTAGSAQGSLGLGLYIAQQIVQSHKGSIEVVSTAEHGTIFTVCLPRHG